jgi:hypothetical protein
MGGFADHAGWVVVAGIVLSLVSALVGRLSKKGPDCKNCGLDDLKAEVRRQSSLIRAIAEKAGFTVKDQLEIERIGGE